MAKIIVTVALALVLVPASVPLLPAWGGIIYGESPAAALQAFQA